MILVTQRGKKSFNATAHRIFMSGNCSYHILCNVNGRSGQTLLHKRICVICGIKYCLKTYVNIWIKCFIRQPTSLISLSLTIVTYKTPTAAAGHNLNRGRINLEGQSMLFINAKPVHNRTCCCRCRRYLLGHRCGSSVGKFVQPVLNFIVRYLLARSSRRNTSFSATENWKPSICLP